MNDHTLGAPIRPAAPEKEAEPERWIEVRKDQFRSTTTGTVSHRQYLPSGAVIAKKPA